MFAKAWFCFPNQVWVHDPYPNNLVTHTWGDKAGNHWLDRGWREGPPLVNVPLAESTLAFESQHTSTSVWRHCLCVVFIGLISHLSGWQLEICPSHRCSWKTRIFQVSSEDLTTLFKGTASLLSCQLWEWKDQRCLSSKLAWYCNWIFPQISEFINVSPAIFQAERAPF